MHSDRKVRVSYPDGDIRYTTVREIFGKWQSNGETREWLQHAFDTLIERQETLQGAYARYTVEFN